MIDRYLGELHGGFILFRLTTCCRPPRPSETADIVEMYVLIIIATLNKTSATLKNVREYT